MSFPLINAIAHLLYQYIEALALYMIIIIDEKAEMIIG